MDTVHKQRRKTNYAEKVWKLENSCMLALFLNHRVFPSVIPVHLLGRFLGWGIVMFAYLPRDCQSSFQQRLRKPGQHYSVGSSQSHAIRRLDVSRRQNNTDVAEFKHLLIDART